MGSKNRLEFHLVFSTKYHNAALLGLEQSVYAAMRNAARGQQFDIVEMAVDKGTHIHLVVRLRPSLSVEQVVSRLKQLTTLELWSKHEDELVKKYWAGKKILWSKGYFAESMGKVSRDVVLDYVRKQAK